jgi:hypothetical protein
MRPAEPALADEGGDRGEADRRDGGDPHPGDDRRQRQRQLDPDELAVLRVAHPGRRLPDVGRHRVEPGDRVAHEDQQRVPDQHDLGGGGGQAGEGDEEGEQRERRDAVDHPHHRQHRWVEALPPPHGHAERDGDGEADGQGDAHELDVLDEAGGDVVAVVRHPLPPDPRVLHRRGDQPPAHDGHATCAVPPAQRAAARRTTGVSVMTDQ